MEALSKLEHKVADLLKGVPHLPSGAQKWLGENIWWIVAIAAGLGVIGALSLLATLFGSLSTLSSPFIAYYTSATYVARASLEVGVALVFVVIQSALLIAAVRPLKERQKKGWTLLFALLVLSAVSIVVGAIVALNPFSFVVDIIFGALWIAISAYFLFEIRGEFARVERSKGVKSGK